jgi:hypothetical protein
MHGTSFSYGTALVFPIELRSLLNRIALATEHVQSGACRLNGGEPPAGEGKERGKQDRTEDVITTMRDGHLAIRGP